MDPTKDKAVVHFCSSFGFAPVGTNLIEGTFAASIAREDSVFMMVVRASGDAGRRASRCRRSLVQAEASLRFCTSGCGCGTAEPSTKSVSTSAVMKPPRAATCRQSLHGFQRGADSGARLERYSSSIANEEASESQCPSVKGRLQVRNPSTFSVSPSDSGKF